MSARNLTKMKQICCSARFVENGIILNALVLLEQKQMLKLWNFLVWNVWNSKKRQKKKKEFPNMEVCLNLILFCTCTDLQLLTFSHRKKFSLKTTIKSWRKSRKIMKKSSLQKNKSLSIKKKACTLKIYQRKTQLVMKNSQLSWSKKRWSTRKMKKLIRKSKMRVKLKKRTSQYKNQSKILKILLKWLKQQKKKKKNQVSLSQLSQLKLIERSKKWMLNRMRKILKIFNKNEQW